MRTYSHSLVSLLNVFWFQSGEEATIDVEGEDAGSTNTHVREILDLVRLTEAK